MDSEDINTIVVKRCLSSTSSQSSTQGDDDLVNNNNNEEDSIKSKAIVKYKTVQVPATFARLQCNTNLNMPPSNWLSNSVNSYGLQHTLYNATGFSSFQMAHMFTDVVGDVDVVSAAENIKNLLKLPYSPQSVISMIVHRIENTLLIDDFDIHKYLLRRTNEDWDWLRSFIVENIIKSLSEKDRNIFLQNKTRDFLKQKNLVSKFLYYSLKGNDTDAQQREKNGEAIPATHEELVSQTLKFGPILPEPNIEENLPEPNKTHVYNRNVVWTFEDIRMLIGTDMPIFGGGTRPCISLRLRDMNEPINVLTGIDYWLDNLMCNVPEVVMCYHLDGIVQKYELIKTEDLPHLEESQFSPRIIRNVAQNILSFLKANATKSGHTYWLFKGRNDDVVKLYDLTTLCSSTSTTGETSDQNKTNEQTDDNGLHKTENPFTIPVAMLLYKVARNMKNTHEKLTPKQAGSIKTLLDNCIKLLPKEKYPQIVTSSYYLLSDLHIPAGTDPGAPNFNTDQTNDDSDDDTYSEYDEGYEPEASNDIAVKIIQETMEEYNLEETGKYNSRPPPLHGNVVERCEMSLENILNGLKCLQYLNQTSDTKPEHEDPVKKQIRHEEDHPQMAKPNQPIPLSYQPLKPTDEARQANPDEAIALGWKTNNEDDKTKTPEKKSKKPAKKSKHEKNKSLNDESNSPRSLLLRGERSWSDHLKILLLEKTCLTYATLAEHYYAAERYGRSLCYIYSALRSQQLVTTYISTVSSQRDCLLGRAGDCFFQLAKNWNDIKMYLDEFKAENEIDKQITLELFSNTEGNVVESQLPLPIDNIEHLMCTSCGCYEAAIDCAKSLSSRTELMRRLGSVRNELGVKYMNWAQEEYNKEMEQQGDDTESDKTDGVEKQESVYQSLACKSYDYLSKGVAAFEEVKDSTNLAFLLCNMGRFMRFRAHIHLPGEKPNCLNMLKKFYYESFTYYNRALGILGSRKFNPDLWDLVNWELSTATFTLAKQVQDYTEKTDCDISEIEIEVIELLQKSLKLCDTETPGSRRVLYQYRSAMIHHRLASFYHQSFRTSADDESRKKTILQLVRLHYEKAAKSLDSLQEPKEFLQVQLERIALQEFLAEQTTSHQMKLRNLQTGLELIEQSHGPLQLLAGKREYQPNDKTELDNLLSLLEKRLQTILRSLAKICLQRKFENSEKMADMYKKMYSVTLTKGEHGNFNEMALRLRKMFTEFKKIQ